MSVAAILAPAAPATAQNPIRVMIVDDAVVVRGLVSRWIDEEPGLKTVASLRNGREAVDQLTRHNPDVVLLDWNMPVMDGYDFLKALRRMPGGDGPKVVFCTTENDVAHIARALSAGANEYIMKPFDKEIVEAKFQEVGLI